MKTLWFYLLFWGFGVVASFAMLVLGIVVPYFEHMLNSGLGDPDLIAGSVAEIIMTWVSVFPIVVTLGYGLYFILRHKVQYSTILIFCILAVFYMSIALGFENRGFGFHWEILLCLASYLFFTIALPSWLIRRRKAKQEALLLTKTFD